jgi:hypothetical protein
MSSYLKMFTLLGVFLSSLNAHADGLIIGCGNSDCAALKGKTRLHEADDAVFSNFIKNSIKNTVSITTNNQYNLPGNEINRDNVFMLQKYENGSKVDLNFDTPEEAESFCESLAKMFDSVNGMVYEQGDTAFNYSVNFSKRRVVAVGVGSKISNAAKRFYYCKNPWGWVSDFQQTIILVTINNNSHSTVLVRQDTNDTSIATVSAHKSIQLWVNKQNDLAFFTKNSIGVLDKLCTVTKNTFITTPVITVSGPGQSHSCS